MAIHYHGCPITPHTVAAKVLAGRHAFISYADPAQLEIAQEVCQSFALDNGAFSVWKRGQTPDWSGYAEWVDEASRHPAYDFCVIPDTITGTEADNNALINEWRYLPRGAPVWHLHESLERLAQLVAAFDRVCLGSSGDYSTPGSESWWNRMAEAMDVACDENGFPRTKLHGLRMLDPALRAIPFASMDSSNMARNAGIDKSWGGPYEPPSKEWRAIVIAERLEAVHCASRWMRPAQRSFALVAP